MQEANGLELNTNLIVKFSSHRGSCSLSVTGRTDSVLHTGNTAKTLVMGGSGLIDVNTLKRICYPSKKIVRIFALNPCMINYQ